MATSNMIEMAARGLPKPGVVAGTHAAADATLYRPRAAEDVEAVERAKSLRQTIRMALGLHDCPRLARCEEHGQDLCNCHPCNHPAHAEHAALAGDALRVLGLADVAPASTRMCRDCGQERPRRLFKSDRYPTCKVCQGKAVEPVEEVASDAGA